MEGMDGLTPDVRSILQDHLDGRLPHDEFKTRLLGHFGVTKVDVEEYANLSKKWNKPISLEEPEIGDSGDCWIWFTVVLLCILLSIVFS